MKFSLTVSLSPLEQGERQVSRKAEKFAEANKIRQNRNHKQPVLYKTPDGEFEKYSVSADEYFWTERIGPSIERIAVEDRTLVDGLPNGTIYSFQDALDGTEPRLMVHDSVDLNDPMIRHMLGDTHPLIEDEGLFKQEMESYEDESEIPAIMAEMGLSEE